MERRHGPLHSPAGESAPSAVPAMRTHQFAVYFEYTGETPLTAVGGATGLRYRFERPGARAIVDPRDRPYLASVRNLREV